MTLAAIQQSALQLSASEKMALIDLLWDSLEGESLAATQRRWVEESEDRLEAIDRGEMSAVDGPSALQDVRKSLRR